jgi:ABC-2 type transport system permease protein
MTKILIIAWREFLATVLTKGFLVGLLLPPILMTVAIVAMPLLLNKKPPSVAGHIAVIDETGVVASKIEDAFSAEKLKQRRDEKLKAAIDQGTKAMGMDQKTADAAKQAASGAGGSGGAGGVPAVPLGMPSLPELPSLSVRLLAPDADAEAEKQPILSATGREQATDGGDARLALLVVPKGVLTGEAKEGGEPAYAKYELFVAPRLDPEVQGDIREQAARAIVDARLEAAGFDTSKIRGLLTQPESQTKAVTKEGERKTNQAAAFLVPGAFMILLWISIFTAGQYLLAGTIEEKGNRVMEVLLSAASPMQLMLGKIIGKGAVGAVILVLYGGAGIGALIVFAMTHLIAWQTLALTLIYFLIAYGTIACIMAAIGAAVTEVTEAQSLLGPVMMILVIPMMLWMPIMRNPNSGFAQACSFVPLINPFVMVLRISGSEPIPQWQIPASILVGILTVLILAWMSAKIFRIGVLMYGKPPDFRTLLKWVRMA